MMTAEEIKAAQQRLDAEVAKRKEREALTADQPRLVRGIALQANMDLTTPPRAPKPFEGKITKRVRAILDGDLTISPEQREQHMRELAEIERRQRLVDQQEAERQFEAKRQKTWEHLCDPLYREQWDWSKVNPEAKRDQLEKILGWEYSPRGLWIFGATGHSKSRAVYTLAARLYWQERRQLIAIDGNAFSEQASQAYYTPALTTKWLKQFQQVEVLIIDDLGKRFTPATQDAVFAIFNYRSNNKLPTLVTINYSGEDLRNMAIRPGSVAEDQSRKQVVNPMLRRVKDYYDILTP